MQMYDPISVSEVLGLFLKQQKFNQIWSKLWHSVTNSCSRILFVDDQPLQYLLKLYSLESSCNQIYHPIYIQLNVIFLLNYLNVVTRIIHSVSPILEQFYAFHYFLF